ncbi:hypothetical protein GCM10025867_13640 [Frondihabitans sucicola]|uniref:Uncharacterized protein n=1 Tax=Frondihabitans sucicola TaxID=1268041 RepID=A0ABM8GL31_9MICO|nr:hypothetical protein [Frondihabitans sucicola]BDZ49123.1 hypothetical protein GCM10025867_13640 [Frondihabitans sucicola]
MIPAAWRFGLAFALWRRYRAAATPAERESAGRAIIVLTAVWAGALALTGFLVLACVAFLIVVVRS